MVGARKSATGMIADWAAPCANSFRTGLALMSLSLLISFTSLFIQSANPRNLKITVLYNGPTKASVALPPATPMH
jgi:hypothetical protein